MAGLEGMTTKDSRVAQNNALKEWMGENGVWVFDRSDWGVAPHALSVAVRLFCISFYLVFLASESSRRVKTPRFVLVCCTNSSST